MDKYITLYLSVTIKKDELWTNIISKKPNFTEKKDDYDKTNR